MNKLNACFIKGCLEANTKIVKTADLNHSFYKNIIQAYQLKAEEDSDSSLTGTLVEISLMLKAGYQYVPTNDDTSIPIELLETIEN